MATKAHLEGNKKYLLSQDEIKVRRPKGEKALIEMYAKNQGKSVNAYINELIDKDMEKAKE